LFHFLKITIKLHGLRIQNSDNNYSCHTSEATICFALIMASLSWLSGFGQIAGLASKKEIRLLWQV
jgi:hypothetical protein